MMVQATVIFGGDSVQYDTLHKRLGEFIDAYPSLPTFESSETGMKKFIGDWVSKICHKKTLWGVDNKEYQIFPENNRPKEQVKFSFSNR